MTLFCRILGHSPNITGRTGQWNEYAVECSRCHEKYIIDIRTPEGLKEFNRLSERSGMTK